MDIYNPNDKFIRQKRKHSLAVMDEIPTIKQRKITIHKYEEITSIAKLIKNNNFTSAKNSTNNNINSINKEKKLFSEKSENKSLNFTANSNKIPFVPNSPNIANKNLNISDISNVAENNSLNNSNDSTFCDLIENFSFLDISNRDHLVNELLYGQNNKNKKLVNLNRKERYGIVLN